MVRKRNLIISIVLVLLLIFSSLAYAQINEYQTNISNEEAIKLKVATETNSVLEALQCSGKIESSDIKLSTTNDPYRKVDYYTIDTSKYKVYIDSSSNKLFRLKLKNYDFTKTSIASKAQAKEFITNIYAELNLPNEYELMYLEQFKPETLWEADFQKNYDGIYNMYEAVKVIFDPISEEIIALSVFNDVYDEAAQLETEFDRIDADSRYELFSTNIDDGDSTEITFIQPSSLKNCVKDDTIRKAYVVKKVTGRRTTLTYFDYYNNEFLGGDILR